MSIIATTLLTLQAGDQQSGNSQLSKVVSALTYTGSQQHYINTYTIGCAPPTGLTVTGSASGGALPAATYYYTVTAVNAAGQTTGSTESSVTTTGTTSSVTLSWTPVTGATSYNIYRGTSPGAENVYYTSTTAAFVDVDATGTSGTPPSSNTTGSTWTPTLTATPLQVFYIRNLSNTSVASLSWTKTGGSSQNILDLMPLAATWFSEPTAPSGQGGITSFTVVVSAPGTPVETFWVV